MLASERFGCLLLDCLGEFGWYGSERLCRGLKVEGINLVKETTHGNVLLFLWSFLNLGGWGGLGWTLGGWGSVAGWGGTSTDAEGSDQRETSGDDFVELLALQLVGDGLGNLVVDLSANTLQECSEVSGGYVNRILQTSFFPLRARRAYAAMYFIFLRFIILIGPN